MIGDKLYQNIKTLSSLSWRFILLAALLLVTENISNAQCTGGTSAGAMVNPTQSYQTTTFSSGLFYKTFTATAGVTYNFTFCSNGGTATYDTEISILDNGGIGLAYEDDYCGTLSDLTWIAPSSGTYRVLVTSFGCLTTTSSSTLAYNLTLPASSIGYTGGTNSGWASTTTTNAIPLSNIFTGGNGQGWASVKTSQLTTLSNFYVGGTHDGWTVGSVSISDPPTVTITSTATDPTNLTSIPVTITFSESVTGFILGDITVTNGTVGGFAGSGSTYTANIAPTAAGPVSVSVAANKATDGVANGNIASNTLTLTYDNVPPTVSITTTATSPTNAAIPVTITFDKSVTGFIVSDITVTNGTAGSFAGSGTTYTATITPTTAGSVSISVAANKANDAASNGNTVSNTLTLTYDNVPPNVAITTTTTSPTNSSTIPVTITFTKSVTGFIVSDITVTNGTAGGFAGSGTTYTATITPTTAGSVSISVPANKANDAATNGNTVSNTLTITYDNVPPNVTITTTATSPTNSSIPVTITFDKSVTGFIVSDMTVTNGTAGSFAGSGTTYTANITPTAAGLVSISVAANKATDAATNGNNASNMLTLTYDNIPPNVLITTTATSPTNSSIPVTITFDKSVTGFITSDITVTNGIVGSFTGSGTTYTANITPNTVGQVTINIAANKAIDLANNGNNISNTLILTYDNVAPVVSISTSVTSPTVLSSIPITITFDKSVTGFIVSDITVTNGTAVNFAGSGTTYTASIVPTATGFVTVSIAAGKATDAATNGNIISNTLSINYQGVPLQITENFVGTFNKGGTLTVSITVNDATKVSKVNFKSRGISEPASALKSVEVSASGNKFEKVVATADLGDAIGLHYYFEVIDQSQLAIESSKGKAYVKYLTSNSEQEIPSLKFGKLQSDYQIISVPLQLTTPSVSSVFKNLMPYDSTQWRLFEYANNDNREYSKFSNIEAGKGYWFISRNQVTINPGEGTAVNVDENSPFTISLAPLSWTLIGNPYNFRISWTEVLAASNNPTGVASVLTIYNNGTLSDGTTLDRYRGGFIQNNTSSIIQLKVPVLRNASLGGGRTSEEINLDKDAWDIPISVTNGLLTNERGGIGMHPKASMTGKDDFDKVSVPLLEGLNMPELVFPTGNPKVSLTKEVVPTQDNFTWPFSVKNSEDAPLKLQWPIIEQKGDRQLIFLDVAGQRVLNMTHENEVILSKESTSFKIIFGDQHYIQNILDKELPAFGQPYPNPASEEVKFPIYISESLDRAKVSIRVYSSTGSEVATLVDDYFNKGIHVLSWKPTVDNGLYFVSMQLGSGKMKKVKLVIH